MFLIILLFIILSFLLKITKKEKNIEENFINDNLDIQVKEIGNGKKVIMIDNFLKEPNKHITKIKENLQKKISQKHNNHYPGIRIHTKKKFNEIIGKFMVDIATEYYNKDIKNYKMLHESQAYSIVNFPNKYLRPGTVFPHVDCQYSKDNNYKFSGLACVIYLCNTTREYNGTGFYEMKCPMNKKKFWTDKKYKKQRQIIEDYYENPRYCTDKEEHIFKKLYEVDAKINRIVIYPTNYYHQGIINPEYYNDENNIRDDRYTYTGFVFFENLKVDKNDIEEPD